MMKSAQNDQTHANNTNAKRSQFLVWECPYKREDGLGALSALIERPLFAVGRANVREQKSALVRVHSTHRSTICVHASQIGLIGPDTLPLICHETLKERFVQRRRPVLFRTRHPMRVSNFGFINGRNVKIRTHRQ